MIIILQKIVAGILVLAWASMGIGIGLFAKTAYGDYRRQPEHEENLIYLFVVVPAIIGLWLLPIMTLK